MPCFVADVMLGRLAKWLRILGFDTLYFRAIDDNELIKIACRQERVLLTRNTGIARRRQVQTLLLIHSNDTFEQLNEVISALKQTESESRGGGESQNPGHQGNLSAPIRRLTDSPVPGFSQSRCTL